MESPSIRMVPGFSMGGGGGGFGISGPTPAWAGYLGKRHDPPAPEETCPWCQAKGLTVTLRTYAINHTETIRLCPTSTCIYPLVSRPLETVLASLSSIPLADQHPSGQTSLKESPTPLPPSAKRARTEESPVQLAAPSSTTAPTPTSLASPKDSTQEVLTEATWEDHNYVRNSDECNEDETNSRVTTCGPSNEEAQVALASDPCPANTARPLGIPTEGSVLSHDAESVATSSTAQASPSLDLGVTKPLNWLTSLLVALAQCRTLRLLSSGQQSASPWFEKLKKARDGSPLLDLCTRYQKNTALLSNQPVDLDNTMARDAENSLDDIHLSTLQLLQQPQTTKTGHGRRSAGQRLEEPAGALRALLQLDNAKELFQHSVQWSSECLECGCDSSCSCSSTVTVHKALVSDCHPLSGPVQIACSRCQSTELKTEILQERVPPVFAVRFMNGPSINDIRTCSFSTADGQYDVTVVIQQRKQEGVADHLYTTWICQPDGSWEAYRSFLDSSGISHPSLDIPSEEVHMAFWEVERRHLHQPITSEASSAEDWPIEEDVCESVVPPDDLSVYSFHEDDTLLEALTPCNLEASAMESSISNATLLDTFEGLSHSDIVSLTLDPGNEGAKQNRKRKARGGPRGKAPKPCAEGEVNSSHVSEEVVSSPLSSPTSVRRSRRLEIKRVERKEKGDAQDEEQQESSQDPEPKTQTCKKPKTSPQNRPEKTSPRQSMAQVATVLQTPPRFVQPCKIIGMSPKATNGPPIQTGQVLMTSPNTIKRPTVLVSQLLGSSPKTTQSPLIQTGQILVTSPNSIKSPSVPVSQLLGSSPKTTQNPLIQTGQILVTSPRTTQSSSIQTVLVVSPKTTQSPSSQTGQVLVASPKATQSPVVHTGKVLLTSNTTQSPFIKAIPVLGTSPKVTPRPSVQTVQVLGTSPKATPIPSVQAIQVLRTSPSVICSPSTQTNAQRGPTLIIPARKSPPKGLVIKRPRPVTPGSGTQNLLLQNVAGENSTKQASANPTAGLNDAKEGKTLNQVFLVSSPNRSVPLVVRSPKQPLEVMPTPVMQSLPDKAISQKKPTFASPTQSSKVYVKKRPTIEPQSPTMSIPIPLNITLPPADTQKTLIPVLATQSATLPSPAMGTSTLPPVAANSAASPSGSKSPPTLDQAVLNPASPLKSQSPKSSDITVQSQTVFSLALENPPLQMQLAQDQPKNTLSPPVRGDLPLKSNSPQCQSLLRSSQPSLHTSVDAPKQNGVVLPEPYVSLAPIEQEPVQALNVTLPLASSSVKAVKPSLPATSSKIQLEQKTDTVSIQSTNESTSSESPPLSSPPKLKRFIPIPECPPFCETFTENQTQGPTTNSLSKPDPVIEITLENVVEESSLPTKALEEIAQMIKVSEVQKENQGNKETSTPALSTTSHKIPSPPQTLASHQQTSESLKEKQQTSESLGEDQQTSESLGDQQTSECVLGEHQMSESVGHHQTSVCVKGNHQTSVCVKEDHQTSEGLIEDQQTSACVRDDEPSPDTIITLDLDIVMDGAIGNEESIPELILPTVISSSHLQLASPQPTAVETSAWTSATPSPPPLAQSTITTAPSTHSSSMGPQCSPSPPQTCHSASYPANAKSNKAPSPLQSTKQQTVPTKPPQRAEKPAGPKITLKHDPDTPMMQHHMFTGFKTQQRASSNSTGLNGSNSSPQEGTTEQLTSKPSPTQPTSLGATRLAALARTSMGSTASVKGQAAALVGAKRSQTPASQDVEAAALRLKLLKKLKAKKQQLAKLDQMMAKRGGVSHPSSAPPSVQAYPSSTTSSPASSHQLPSPQTSETLSPEGTDMLEMLVSGSTDNLKSVLENASTPPPLQHLQHPSNGPHPAPHADFLTIDDFLDDVIFDTAVTQKTGENPDFDDTLDMFL